HAVPPRPGQPTSRSWDAPGQVMGEVCSQPRWTPGIVPCVPSSVTEKPLLGRFPPSSVRRLKRALARVATTDPVGRAVAVLTRDRVRTKGLVFDTSMKEFTPS